MLYLNLQHIFKIRQIERPYTFLVKIGIAPHTATKILSSNVYIMRLNHIEMICRALYCEPNDLLAFKQETNNPLPESHPLLNLLPSEENNNWQEQLKTMPLSKLNKISKMLNQTNDPIIE
jgi:DNA-binding Xre family transcriptional regulator